MLDKKWKRLNRREVLAALGAGFGAALARCGSSATSPTSTTTYPGSSSGGATNIYVEIYRSGPVVKTTQIAFPESLTAAVYGTGAYTARGQNPTSNAGDNVFSDGTSTELAALSGSAGSG